MIHHSSRAAVYLLAGFLLAGCDQSINESGLSEPKLTGMYCEAKDAQQQSCKAGDIVVTVAGREQLLCDWAWQIVHKPGSDEVLCVHRGALRESRSGLLEPKPAGVPER
jgi:hypothetical protein